MSHRACILTGTIPIDFGSIHDLAVVEVDGDQVFLCATGDSTIWSWRPSKDEWREHSLALPFGDDPKAAESGYGGPNEFDRLAAVVHDGRIIVAAGDDEQPPALWELESGRLVAVGDIEAPYSGAITAICGDPPRIVTGSQYVGQVLSWDPSGLMPPLEFPEDVDFVQCLAAKRVGDRVLLAIGEDGVVVRDLSTREEIASLDTDTDTEFEDEDDEADVDEGAAETDDRIFAVAIDHLGGRPVVLGGSADPARVFVWDIATAGQIIRPLSGHEDSINAIASIHIDGRLVAITGSDDGTVRLWDIAAATAIGEPLTDHRGRVQAVLTTKFDGRDVVVTAGHDGVIRIWDPAALLA